MLLIRCLLAVAIGFAYDGFAQGKDDLYNQVGILRGTVFIVNNPQLGRTPASGQYFALQRTDCRRCAEAPG